MESLVSPLYKEVVTGEGEPALRSFQGFWLPLKEHLEKRGHQVTVEDKRVETDRPDLQQALLGLREPQKPWILRALLSGESGLLGAPTRFGKTYGIAALLRAFPTWEAVVAAPGVSLCAQLVRELREILPHRNVVGVFSGPESDSNTQGPDITVCSMDSLEKMSADTPLLIVDEPHAAVSEKRLPHLAKFYHARKYGFGATLTGRFDKRDMLIVGAIGSVITNVTYQEAVATKSISPLKVVMIEVPFSKDTVPGNLERDVVYDRLLCRSSRTARLIKSIMELAVPDDWQTMAFIMNEDQADYYMQHAMPPHGTVAMAKKLTPKTRRDLTAAIAEGIYTRVLASNIYVQGVTFPDLKVVINLAGGGANTTAIQKPGRLLQTRPGKNYGVMIDLMFRCHDHHLAAGEGGAYMQIINECKARLKAYTDIGYDVVHIAGEGGMQKLKHIIDNAYQTSPETNQP